MSAASVETALLIAEPWIDLILRGEKDWEMRGRRTRQRGWFGLIRAGSGRIEGAARLIDVGDKLDRAGMLRTQARHRIPAEMIESGAVDRWSRPWILADVVRFATPIPYEHPYGAVTWVRLKPELAQAVAEAIAEAQGAAPEPEPDPAPAPTPASAPTAAAPPSVAAGRLIGESVLTEGNLRNAHFYLTDFLDRFPADALGGRNKAEAGRPITLIWDEAEEPVETDIDRTKRLFRKRGWVRRFFEKTGAKVGDSILIAETGARTYAVQMGRYDPIMLGG